MSSVDIGVVMPQFIDNLPPFHRLTSPVSGRLIPGMNIHLEPKFAFVVAERPKYNPASGVPDPEEKWQGFLGNAKNIPKPPEGMQKIHDNVWLMPLATGLPFLGQLIQWADSYRVAIRILFVDEAPNWLQYPPPADHTGEAYIAQPGSTGRDLRG